MKVKSKAFAQAAIDALGLGITYQQEDCQAFVENTVKRAGGEMKNYRGSNDMFRNACDSVHPLSVSIKEGLLAPGCLLFIVEDDGNEPDIYRSDGLGNASHVGIYTGGDPEVVHSSASRGGVVASTLKNGWTHAGWAKAIDYVNSSYNEAVNVESATVTAESGSTVRMRIKPDKKSMANENVPIGSIVEVIAKREDWWQISYNGKTGWMMKEFLSQSNGDSHQDDTETLPNDRQEIDRIALLVELQGLTQRQKAIINFLLEGR